MCCYFTVCNKGCKKGEKIGGVLLPVPRDTGGVASNKRGSAGSAGQIAFGGRALRERQQEARTSCQSGDRAEGHSGWEKVSI